MTHPVLARARVALIRAQFLAKAGDLDGAAAALARTALTPSRVEAELSILLDSDNLAAWADEVLVFDRFAFSRIGTADDSPDVFIFPDYRRALREGEAQPLSAKNFKTRLVGLLRDAMGLPLPSGLTSTGPYKVRNLGSVVPCVRFRTAADGEAPGVIRYAMQLRMYQSKPQSAESPVGNGSAESVTGAEWQKASQGTDGTDVTDKSDSHVRGQFRETSLYGEGGPLSVTSVPSVPDQGSCRSRPVPDPFPSVTDPFPVGAFVEVHQPDGSWRNGWKVSGPPDAAGLIPLARVDGPKQRQHVRRSALRRCSG